MVQIESAFHNDELFLNQSFSISMLAEHIGCQKNDASSAISGGLKIGFSDYLNSLRIDYYKSLLAEVNLEKVTIEGVGYQSGFYSKASFYRAFKKFTSSSPTEFLKKK
ncbi:MAG: YesN/AraC family two-component response regulator [Arenicella sp.]